MDELALAAEFPASTREDWAKAVERVLKGADFDRVLVGRTHEGLRTEPIYPGADATPRPGRGATPWNIVARLDHPEPAAGNAMLLSELDGGADAIAVVWPQAGSARGFGVAARDLAALDAALSGVMLDLVAIRLEAGPAGRQAAALMAALAERRGHRLGDLDLDLGLDPIGAAARAGQFSAPWEIVGSRLSDTLADLDGQGFGGRLAVADGRPWHEAGCGEAQELAGCLATALAYLRALEAGGHDLDRARDALSFLLVADADELLTVAKFRAMRQLWAAIEESCGLVPRPIRLAAETSYRMTTRRDPWTNLLRGTLATFSAGIGGADSIAVLPFTAALGLPDGFARRLARNTQLLLLEETNLARVADPVAGSGAFEGLTAMLVEKAWVLFGEIEREGGIVATLASGAFAHRIAEVRARRETAAAGRRDGIIGTSEFPHLRETPVAVMMERAEAGPPSLAGSGRDMAFGQMIKAAGGGTDLGALSVTGQGGESFAALPSVRTAEPFERLRDASDATLASSGKRPSLFLATLGTPAAFTTRAMFARNAFEAVGVEAVGGETSVAVEALAEAFRASGAATACLCSSDAIYEAQAGPAAIALKAAGASRVLLAGRPGAHEAEWREAGIGGFIGVGSDLPAELGMLSGDRGP